MTLEYAGQYQKKSLLSKVVEVEGIATGAGAASMTLTTGLKNVASIAETATGKYTITFTKVGTKFLGGHFTVLSATGAGYDCHPVAYSASNKTLTIEIYDQDKNAHDLTSSEQLWITLKWADTDTP